MGPALGNPHSETHCEGVSLSSYVLMITKAEKLNMCNCTLSPKVST